MSNDNYKKKKATCTTKQNYTKEAYRNKIKKGITFIFFSVTQ